MNRKYVHSWGLIDGYPLKNTSLFSLTNDWNLNLKLRSEEFVNRNILRLRACFLTSVVLTFCAEYFYVMGSSPMRCKVFGSIPVLCLPDNSITPLMWQPTVSSDIANVPWRGAQPLLSPLSFQSFVNHGCWRIMHSLLVSNIISMIYFSF